MYQKQFRKLAKQTLKRLKYFPTLTNYLKISFAPKPIMICLNTQVQNTWAGTQYQLDGWEMWKTPTSPKSPNLEKSPKRQFQLALDP